MSSIEAKVDKAKDSLCEADLNLTFVYNYTKNESLKGCLQCLHAAIVWLERYERENS